MIVSVSVIHSGKDTVTAKLPERTPYVAVGKRFADHHNAGWRQVEIGRQITGRAANDRCL